MDDRFKEMRIDAEVYRRLFQLAPDGMLLYSRSGKILDANEASTSLLGISRDELIGLDVGQVLLQHTGDGFEFVQNNLLSGLKLDFETDVLSKENRSSRVWIRGASLENSDDPYLMIMVRDISEHSTRETMVLEREKRKSMARILAGMAGYLELRGSRLTAMAGGDRSTRLGELGWELSRASKHLILSSQQDPGGFRPVSVASMVRRAIESFEADWPERKVVFQIAVVDNCPMLFGDSLALEKMLCCLFENAATAMEEIREQPRVTIDAMLMPNSVPVSLKIRVGDRGAGFSEQIGEMIYEPFFSGWREPRAGLGLTLVQHTVTTHDGRIWATSTQGKGSIFNIQLPIHHTGRHEGTPAPWVQVRRPEKEKIFVLSETPSADFIPNRLARAGYDVLVLRSMEDVRNTFSKNHEGLVLVSLIEGSIFSPRELHELFKAVGIPRLWLLELGCSKEVAGLESWKEEVLLEPYSISSLMTRIRRLLGHVGNS